MAKPLVQVLTAKTLYAGRVARITVQITAEKPTKCDFISARLRGEQGWVVGGGKNTVTRRIHFPAELEFDLSGPTELAAGVMTPFVLEVRLPEGMPPSHDIDPAFAFCQLRIHVSIPWRIDGRYKFLLPIGVPPPAVVERTPYAVRSNKSTGSADRPRIEVSLASSRLIAGETLVGTVAVYHLDDAKPRDVELSLVPMLALNSTSRDRERRGSPFTSTLTLPAGSAGSGVPFRLALPASMTPSFSSLTHDLSWWLVATTGSFFRGGKLDVSVPLEIVDAAALATTEKLTEPPRLGDERVAGVFAQFAAKNGWRGGDPDADADDPPTGQFSIEADVGDLVVRIAYDYRGEDGTFLVSRVEHRSLGLALSVSPSSAVRHMFFRDIEVAIDAWDRAHHVTARFAEQTVPFLRGVVPALQQEELGALRRWSDTELVFDRPSPTVTSTELAKIGNALFEVAAAIERSAAKLQPPPSVTFDLDAWRALAAKCKGHLAYGDMAITGTLDGVPVEIKPAWTDKRMSSVRVTFGSSELASDALRAVTLSLPNPARDVLGRDVAEALVDPLTRWPNDIVNLRVEDGIASATLVLAEKPVLDAARVRELIEMLRVVLGALGPGGGPYR